VNLHQFSTSTEESDFEDDSSIKETKKSRSSPEHSTIHMSLRSRKKRKRNTNILDDSYDFSTPVLVGPTSTNSFKHDENLATNINIDSANQFSSQGKYSLSNLKFESAEDCNKNIQSNSSTLSTQTNPHSSKFSSRRKLSDDLSTPLGSYFLPSMDNNYHEKKQKTQNLPITNEPNSTFRPIYGLQTLLEVARLYKYISDLEDNAHEVERLQQELEFQTQECLIWKKKAFELERELLERTEHCRKEAEKRDKLSTYNTQGLTLENKTTK
jgi:hypothetical protein